MAAPKRRRIPITIDMTPMVDIAFLLLIFFMSTTVFKKPEEVAVQTPSSHSALTLPETGIIVITVPKNNQILLSLDNAALDYQNGLSEQVGVKLQAKRFTAEDIPPVINALQMKRLVNRVVIRADKDAEYGTIESIMQTLQKNDLNIVNLVTELEDDVQQARPSGREEAARGTATGTEG